MEQEKKPFDPVSGVQEEGINLLEENEKLRKENEQLSKDLALYKSLFASATKQNESLTARIEAIKNILKI